MSTVTIRMNADEEHLYREYAKFRNIPLSTLMKEALEEKIEDELDLKAISDYESRVAEGQVEYTTLEDIKKELGL